MSNRPILLIQLIVTILVLLGTYFAFTNFHYFENYYVREDGPLEWLTFIAHICTFSVCIIRLIRCKGPFLTLLNLSLLGIGLIFLFGAGEEISWGQRIFLIPSPDYFIQHNSQREINIHNLIINEVRINRVIFGTIRGIVVAFYFLIIPIIFARMNKFRNLINNFAIPIPSFSLVLFYSALAMIVYTIPSQKKGEVLEFLGGWVFFMLVLSPKNKYIFDSNGNHSLNFIK